MYTKEQLKQLKELGAVEHFNTVLDSQYKRGTLNSLNNKVADIYDEATSGQTSRNFSCKTCVYNLYRDAGLLYRKSEKYYKDEALRKAREAKANKTNNSNTKKTNEQ